MGLLQGKRILITGASSGIGLGTARMLLQAGAIVIGACRRPACLPEGVIPFQVDLTREDEIHSLFARMGELDALVNNAGVAYLSRIMDGDPAEWEEMWRVNVMALTLCSQLAIQHFPSSGGSIVNVSSMSGHRVPPSGGFYASTKFAVRAISDALRFELKEAGVPVRVGCVSPGFVDTPLLGNYFRGREDVLEQAKSSMTMLHPDDVARCILQLLETPAHVEIGDVLLRSADPEGMTNRIAARR